MNKSRGFLLSPYDKTSCGGYILRHENVYTLEQFEFACEGDEYICGMDGQKYIIEGGMPNGELIEKSWPLYRNYNEEDLCITGEKVIPFSERMKNPGDLEQLQIDPFSNFNMFDMRRSQRLGIVGGLIQSGRTEIITDAKPNKFGFIDRDTFMRLEIDNKTYDFYKRIRGDLSHYFTKIIKHLAGSAHSQGTCGCRCRFIPKLNITYTFDKYAQYGVQSVQQNPIRNTQQKRQMTPPRQPVDPGFCVVPDQTTPNTYELELMINPPSGVKELYRELNPERKKKPGSILIVADPLSDSPEKIKKMQIARDKIDAALEPLTVQEAKLLHDNRGAVDAFSHQLFADNLSKAGDGLGYISEIGKSYYEETNRILREVEDLYKNTYNRNNGIVSGKEFFGQRTRLFKQLDLVLTKFSKAQLNLGEYHSIKRALGLSTRSIMHRWDRTGVDNIEGYASYIEKSAKLMKIMKTVGYVGIGLDFASYTSNVYDACSKGRESECRKVAITEYSKFGTKQGVSYAAGAIGAWAGNSACMWILGLATSEVGAIGAGLCLVTGIGTGMGAAKMVEGKAEDAGEYFGEHILYEKLFK
ncbi:hypothetical protein [Enterobacter sp. RHBSTW-00175]|uniref:hypothetical protein n=1 Tax=Enterobacter sp. RHBSTW-00175 TaxID=2742639 RepID=UPI002174EBCB|nr:hypothetical protein [Enterobacter sp. RHBSTW-00175]